METWEGNYIYKEDAKRYLRDNALDQIASIALDVGHAEEKINRIIGVLELLSLVTQKMKEGAGDAATT